MAAASAALTLLFAADRSGQCGKGRDGRKRWEEEMAEGILRFIKGLSLSLLLLPFSPSLPFLSLHAGSKATVVIFCWCALKTCRAPNAWKSDDKDSRLVRLSICYYRDISLTPCICSRAKITKREKKSSLKRTSFITGRPVASQ